MEFSQVNPHPALKSFIDYYWIIEGTEILANKIIPDGKPELIFHYHDPYSIEQSGRFHLQASALAAGQLTKPITIKPTGRSGVIGLKFKPSGFWKLFGRNTRELTNEVLDVKDVLSDFETTNIVEALSITLSIVEKVRIVERLLFQYLPETRTSFTEYFLGKIDERKGAVSIDQICKQEKISQKNLNGLSRKKLEFHQRCIHVLFDSIMYSSF